jgi:hypothetical protein
VSVDVNFCLIERALRDIISRSWTRLIHE